MASAAHQEKSGNPWIPASFRRETEDYQPHRTVRLDPDARFDPGARLDRSGGVPGKARRDGILDLGQRRPVGEGGFFFPGPLGGW